jgi:hypothetical protein
MKYETTPDISYFPQVTLENAGKWSRETDVPLYALGEQTAVKVMTGK